MNRTKLFLENFFVYGLGSILSKIAPLIMLPIITRLMPDSTYYGLSDLSSITISFGTAIAIMGMYDAMFRMFFEKDEFEYKSEVCSSAFSFVMVNGLIMCLILFTFKLFFSELIFNDIRYVNLLNFTSFTILVNTLSSIVIAPTRMQNKRKIFLVTNTISPILGYSISVPMLLHNNYLYALPAAALFTSAIMLIFFYVLNRKWFDFKKINFQLIKGMLKIGAPLMPSFIIYWIFTSCDRIMISKMIGTSYVGIYGIGARAASISQFIYIAFAGGWQYFAFSTMKDKDQVQLTSNIFEYLALVAFSCFIILIPFTHFIFQLFFKGNYVNGYVVFPYLFLSPLVLMLFQTITSQFLVVKKTWPCTAILILGAITNVILNYFLINFIGIEGSAIATLLGYVVSVTIAAIVLSKMKLLYVSKRIKILSLTLSVYFILWRLISPVKILPGVLMAIPTLFIFYYLYRVDINRAYQKGKIFLKNRKFTTYGCRKIFTKVKEFNLQNTYNEYMQLNKRLKKLLIIVLGVTMSKWGQRIIIILLSFSLVGVIICGIYRDKKIEKQILLDNQKLLENIKNEQASAVVAGSSIGSIYDKISKKQSISILILGDAQASSDGVVQEDKWTTKVKRWLTFEYGVNVDLKILAIPRQNAFGALASYQKLGANTYDLTVICLGENDITDLNLNAFQTSYEELIRAIKASRTSTEIMTLVESSIQINTTYPKAILDISSHYNLLSVDMRAEFKKSSLPYDKLSSDTILPNKDGYNIYASAVENAIKNPAASKRNVKFEDNGILNAAAKNYAALKTISEIDKNEGFTQNSDGFSSSTIGHSLSYKFTGNLIGASLKFGKSSGKLIISIDDKLVKEIDCYSPSEAKSALLISDALTQGEHTIKFTISNIKNGNSSGTEANIYDIITN